VSIEHDELTPIRHTHSSLELRFGQVFYRDAHADTDAARPLYMRMRNGLTLVAALGWMVVAGGVLIRAIDGTAPSLAMLAGLAAWLAFVANFWWFEYVRIDATHIERSQLFGLARQRGRISDLRAVDARPLLGRGGRRTPSLRFEWPDRTVEVRAGAHHWVDGRKLMRRLQARGIPIAPILVEHFELFDGDEHSA